MEQTLVICSYSIVLVSKLAQDVLLVDKNTYLYKLNIYLIIKIWFISVFINVGWFLAHRLLISFILMS